MRILALNCGSSSIKSAVIDPARGQHLLQVRVENIGENIGSGALLRINGDAPTSIGPADQAAALQVLLAEIRKFPQAPQAVAHRVVHGGARFTQPVLIDDDAEAAIAALNSLAPLHNPPALAAIRQARQILRDVPHIAVFDTAFHATLPPRAREYALPLSVAQQFGIRRFGFHGTSHAHVMRAGSEYLRAQPQDLRIISCHLGNGASVSAIEYGRSVETSMGMTPLEGLVMGTRCGDIDPGVLLHLMSAGGYDPAALERLLNAESGLHGLTGTQDMQQIAQRAADGDEGCRRAITLYSHRVRKYVGAYAAVMGGVDVLAFTGGIGENSALIRHRIAQRLEFLGIMLDADHNAEARPELAHPVVEISTEVSRARLLVIRADEEMSMAREAAALLEGGASISPPIRIPIAISARHAHLGQPTLDKLFGPSHQLQPRTPLSQPGQFSAQETVSLIGPRGRIDKVRLMGPPRDHDQVEISRSDEFVLGIDAPVRISGDINNTPGITLEGPAGRATIPHGVITARRHIHMSAEDAARFGLHDHDSVQVKIDSEGRDLTFGDVVVRVSPEFKLEMHLDTDEANAAGIQQGDSGELLLHNPQPRPSPST
jgi:acetate kinase